MKKIQTTNFDCRFQHKVFFFLKTIIQANLSSLNNHEKLTCYYSNIVTHCIEYKYVVNCEGSVYYKASKM